jgi:hypothetical protein
MPEHRFTYPRVVPTTAKSVRPDATTAASAPNARTPRSQRELVAASLVRCPPRDGRRPGKLKR